MLTAGRDPVLMASSLPPGIRLSWLERVQSIGSETVSRGLAGANLSPLNSYSPFQTRVREALDFLRIPYIDYGKTRDQLELPLFDNERNRFFVFRPDFEIPCIRINGRPVFIEPHSVFWLNKKNINKFEIAHATYWRSAYIVIVLDCTDEAMERALQNAGMAGACIANETWCLAQGHQKEPGGRPNSTIDTRRGLPQETKVLLRNRLLGLLARSGGEDGIEADMCPVATTACRAP